MYTRWTKRIVLVLMFCSCAHTAERKVASVCITDEYTSAHSLESNKRIISRIFDKVGVEIQWQECTATAETASKYQIRFIDRAPASASPTALAFTHVYGSGITIFHDRVQRQLSMANPAARNVAVAYVIAHELAHAMQGIARHSETGILKPVWSNADFAAMLFEKLVFTKADEAFIQAGVR